MTTTHAGPSDRYVKLDTGVTLHVRIRPGDLLPFVLVHGLSSNCMTWEMVARSLAQAGHAVISVDQRGHGLSDKPESGYDFATVTDDLVALLDALEIAQPILAGQSWGGNVALELAARHPALCRGYCFVDGGFLDLQRRPHATWEKIAEQLRPAEIDGMPATALQDRIRHGNPDWSDEGVAATMANFAIADDGTIRRQLPIRHHMTILRAMWDQRPPQLYPRVHEPVLICPAEDGSNPEWAALKGTLVDAAATALAHAEVRWFHQTHHDIHIHRPNELSAAMLTALRSGIWS